MGDIIGEMLFFTILNFIGGTIRWLIATLWSFIFNTNKLPYKEYIYSSETDEFTNDGANGCFNLIIGFLFVFLVIYIVFNI